MLFDLFGILIWLASGVILIFVVLLGVNYKMHRDHLRRRRGGGESEWEEGEVP